MNLNSHHINTYKDKVVQYVPMKPHVNVVVTPKKNLLKARKAHGDKYDYSKVNYVNNKQRFVSFVQSMVNFGKYQRPFKWSRLSKMS